MREGIEKLGLSKSFSQRLLFRFFKLGSLLMPSSRRAMIIASFKRWIRYCPWHCRWVSRYGLNSETRDRRIIVSLTSYPKRIKTVHRVITALLKQTLKPDKVILWLGHDKFPRHEADLPTKLLKLRKYGLTIEWCRDLRSYTKLIPALTAYPDDIIITVDDDMFYSTKMVENLYRSYLTRPQAVHCNGVREIAFDASGRLLDYSEWNSNAPSGSASFRYLLLGFCGVLYPPHSLSPDVFSESKFLALSPNADDLWFWAMAVKAGTPICKIANAALPVDSDNCASQDDALMNLNCGQGKNDTQFRAILDEYPMLLQLLKNEPFLAANTVK